MVLKVKAWQMWQHIVYSQETGRSWMKSTTRDGNSSWLTGFIWLIQMILVSQLSGRSLGVGRRMNCTCPFVPLPELPFNEFNISDKKGQFGITVSWYYRPEQVIMHVFLVSYIAWFPFCRLSIPQADNFGRGKSLKRVRNFVSFIRIRVLRTCR